MNRFRLDKRNAKLAGVCSGVANFTGWDVTIVRIVTVVGTVLLWGGLIIVYAAAALIAQPETTV